MKVVLAKPCWQYPKGRNESTYNRVWLPLELANCAAIFRNAGHEAAALDGQALGLSPAALAKRAEGADLVILTSTGLDRWQCPYNDARPFVETARALKSAHLPVVVTGFHGTVNPEATLAATGADACIHGEPEGAVADIAATSAITGPGADGRFPRLAAVTHFERANAGRFFADIPGLSYRDGGGIVTNPAREAMDIAAFPVPAFDLFGARGYAYEVLGDDFLLFETTRGCPYNCEFCTKVMYAKGFRRKSAAQVASEIDFALANTDVKTAYFIDLEFTVARELAEAVCRHLISRGAPLRWCCQTRADNVDPQLLALMREAGCRLVHVGVESGSDAVLSSSGKGTSKGKVFDGVRMIEAAGMETLGFFMFGLPGETDRDREATIRFALELAPTYASFHFATPYPGSRLSGAAATAMADDLTFPLVSPGEDIDVLRGWVNRAMRAFYLRPSYVARHALRGNPAHWLRQLRLFASYIR